MLNQTLCPTSLKSKVLHLVLLNSMSLLSAHLSRLSRAFWTVVLPSRVMMASPSLVSTPDLLWVCSLWLYSFLTERSKSTSPETTQILASKLKQDMEAGCTTSKQFDLVTLKESVNKVFFSCWEDTATFTVYFKAQTDQLLFRGCT